jgi:hypothetical protein
MLARALNHEIADSGNFELWRVSLLGELYANVVDARNGIECIRLLIASAMTRLCQYSKK